MPELQLILITSLVAYRVTRFLLRDSLIDGPRKWLYEKLLRPYRTNLAAPGQRWRDKVYELLDCPYCTSVWVAAATVAAVDAHGVSVPMPLFAWLATASGAMVVWRVVERSGDDE